MLTTALFECINVDHVCVKLGDEMRQININNILQENVAGIISNKMYGQTGHVVTNPGANMIKLMINLYDVITHKSPIYMKYLTLIKGPESSISITTSLLCVRSHYCVDHFGHTTLSANSGGGNFNSAWSQQY